MLANIGENFNIDDSRDEIYIWKVLLFPFLKLLRIEGTKDVVRAILLNSKYMKQL